MSFFDDQAFKLNYSNPYVGYPPVLEKLQTYLKDTRPTELADRGVDFQE